MREKRRARRISLTSLIDVIFLLLLFFMLTSSFSRFAEVELSAGGTGGRVLETAAPPLFLQVSPEGLRLNGDELAPVDLQAKVRAHANPKAPQPVLVSLDQAVTAQRLTDILVVLTAVPGLSVTFLGAS